jgi:hypothetical protein
MVVIAAGLLAFLLFAGLAEAARRGNRAARAAATVEGVVLIPLAGLGALLALLLQGFTCDDHCDSSPSAHWSNTTDAWQWRGQLLVAALGFLAVGAAVALMRSRSYRWATASMTLATASFGAWAAILAPLGNRLGI